jgi:hypothetical protein
MQLLSSAVNVITYGEPAAANLSQSVMANRHQDRKISKAKPECFHANALREGLSEHAFNKAIPMPFKGMHKSRERWKIIR